MEEKNYSLPNELILTVQILKWGEKELFNQVRRAEMTTDILTLMKLPTFPTEPYKDIMLQVTAITCSTIAMFFNEACWHIKKVIINISDRFHEEVASRPKWGYKQYTWKEVLDVYVPSCSFVESKTNLTGKSAHTRCRSQQFHTGNFLL